MINRKKEILIGIVVGIIATFIGMFFYSLYSASTSNLTQETAIKVFFEQGKLGHLISMGAILNLLAFFIFLKRKQDYRARGVLLATIFTAIIVLILQFI
ncbi:hypothetical protein [Spongiivirga citrea]|uniref:DUF1634 domain-containing protein n=1 Tax=Spongiivirga citrea TaxID=1481457 RepID=A0A6M0CWW7_9FLAO|nr:hypothetical protein [Spongiivirga citrea]NER18220.1 hypothetical protein [Spongiivirga citrea]